MFAVCLTAEWAAWITALADPLHRRLAWRLTHVVVGILLAAGRRTATSWWRAAGIGDRFRSYYCYFDSLGRKVADLAAVLLSRILLSGNNSRGRLPLITRDDNRSLAARVRGGWEPGPSH